MGRRRRQMKGAAAETPADVREGRWREDEARVTREGSEGQVAASAVIKRKGGNAPVHRETPGQLTLPDQQSFNAGH